MLLVPSLHLDNLVAQSKNSAKITSRFSAKNIRKYLHKKWNTLRRYGKIHPRKKRALLATTAIAFTAILGKGSHLVYKKITDELETQKQEKIRKIKASEASARIRQARITRGIELQKQFHRKRKRQERLRLEGTSLISQFPFIGGAEWHPRSIWHYAAHGDVQHLQELIDAGVNMNRQDCSGNTALEIAAKNDQLQATQYLLKLEHQASKIESAFHKALFDGSTQMVKEFVEHISSALTINEALWSLTFFQSDFSEIPEKQEKIAYLLKDPRIDVNHPIKDLSRMLASTSWAISAEVDKPYEDTIAVHAARRGDLNLAQLFLQHPSCNIHQQRNSLRYALESKVRSLCFNMMHNSYEWENHYKYWPDNGTILHRLLQLDISKDVINNLCFEKSKETVLMHAANFGKIEVVKILLNAKGIDPFKKNSKGKTAFDFADDYQHRPIYDEIKRLMAEKAAPRMLRMREIGLHESSSKKLRSQSKRSSRS